MKTNRHIHTAVTGGRQLSDFNIIRILIVRYIRKTKLLQIPRCLPSVQWTTTVAANVTNSITVVRTLNMLIASYRHRFSSLLLTELEVCHSHEIRTLQHVYSALYSLHSLIQFRPCCSVYLWRPVAQNDLQDMQHRCPLSAVLSPFFTDIH